MYTQVFTFEAALPGDIEPVRKILSDSSLPYIDIDEHFNNFILAKINEKIIGVIGLEIYGNTALLRSFAIIEEYRNQKIGKKLLDRILDYSKLKNILEVYLLTTSAMNYFNKFGFVEVDRTLLPKSIQATREFQSICPVSAICMKISLDNKQ